MPRLTKIYTRKGDDGTTALGTRQRVKKNSDRVASYGEIDELNSVLGLTISLEADPKTKKILVRIQNELLVLGAELAYPADQKEFDIPKIKQRHIDSLENNIDELNEQLGPLENFILPGGSPGAASLQIARSVCRRAERKLVSLSEIDKVRSEALAYINRLSDLLFVLARYENKTKGGKENIWDSHI